MNDIPGLPRRRDKCKICNVLPDKDLAELTEVLIRESMSVKDILATFTPRIDREKAEAGGFNMEINNQNVVSHRGHCDPHHLLDRALQRTGTHPVDRYEATLDEYVNASMADDLAKMDAKEAVFRKRLEAIREVEEILIKRKLELSQIPEGEILRRKKSEGEVLDLTERFDKLWRGLDQDFIAEIRAKKDGMSGTNIFILPDAYFTNLRVAMDNIIGGFRRILPDDSFLVKRLVEHVATCLDDGTQDMLDQSNLEVGEYEILPTESES